MIDALPVQSQPAWLTALTPEAIQQVEFPLHDVLQDSLYYPSSGFDGDPVRYLAGSVFSFIYVDYVNSKDEFTTELSRSGFRGYQILANRDVTMEELVPGGWSRPKVAATGEDFPSYPQPEAAPFCRWVVFQRQEDAPDSHGPERFSLLYLCAEGVAAFHALYENNGLVPLAVAVIQPGTGFGGNWTDFDDPRRIFATTVLNNPAGQPRYLLFGGIGKRDFYREPCWTMYSEHLGFVDKAGGGSIGLWARSE